MVLLVCKYKGMRVYVQVLKIGGFLSKSASANSRSSVEDRGHDRLDHADNNIHYFDWQTAQVVEKQPQINVYQTILPNNHSRLLLIVEQKFLVRPEFTTAIYNRRRRRGIKRRGGLEILVEIVDVLAHAARVGDPQIAVVGELDVEGVGHGGRVQVGATMLVQDERSSPCLI